MQRHLQHISDVLHGKAPLGKLRSSEWPTFRKHHMADKCAACGGTEKLELHHKRPFHLHPKLELDPNNVITLCESKKNGVNCHLLFGHKGNFKSFNIDVLKDAAIWLKKILTRPKA
jgi:hypothetical protein